MSSEGLAARLRARIRREGPIAFAEFMEAALYDPDEGFYARPPIGASGHYVTSPHVSGCFAELLAVQLRQCRAELATLTLTLAEAGAGDGTLAAQLLSALGDPVSYVAVERSAGARAALAARGLTAVASLGDVSPFEGVILANELLDNVPFHRVRRRGEALVEVCVGLDSPRDDRFVEVEAAASPQALEALGAVPMSDGEERPSSPGWRAWVREVARVLVRGWAIVIDYGFARGETAQSVRGYTRQRVTEDVLSAPGSRDISTGVDLDVLASEARAHGLDVWGPVTQADALRALGYREWMDGLRARQAGAEARGDHRLALQLFAERSRAPMLVDPAQLGSLRVIVFGRDVPPPQIVQPA